MYFHGTADVEDPLGGSLGGSVSSDIRDDDGPPADGEARWSFLDGVESARPERFAERVYETLFHAIVTGRAPLGSRLPSENELARKLNISRPVVRQAFDRLREDGLIETRHGSGTYVTEALSDSLAAFEGSPVERIGHILNGLELRLVVEPEIAYMAALRRRPSDLVRMEAMLERFEAASAAGDVAHPLDYAFHDAIAVATSNPRFAEVLKSLEYDVSHAINLMRHLVQLDPLTRSPAVAAEHREIFERIRERDAEGARRAMRAHLEYARIRMLTVQPGI